MEVTTSAEIQGKFGDELCADPGLQDPSQWIHNHNLVGWTEGGGAQVIARMGWVSHVIEELDDGQYVLEHSVVSKPGSGFILSVADNVIYDGFQRGGHGSDVVWEGKSIIDVSVDGVKPAYRGIFFYGTRGYPFGVHNSLIVRRLSLRRVLGVPVSGEGEFKIFA